MMNTRATNYEETAELKDILERLSAQEQRRREGKEAEEQRRCEEKEADEQMRLP